jgi:hypothetical protein
MINGIPTWIPPRWIDPDQQPMINYRILDRLKTERGAESPPPRGTPPSKAKDMPAPSRQKVVGLATAARPPAMVPG